MLFQSSQPPLLSYFHPLIDYKNRGDRSMTWCDDYSDAPGVIVRKVSSCNDKNIEDNNRTMPCPSCDHRIKCNVKARIHDLPGLPAGVKFDPSDQELLEHLEAKVHLDAHKLHPLIDEFICTLEGENGICYTHPEKLPGVSKDGLVRHFFHRPSKAYTTGTRKRRKVHSEADGSETRWHKTGKTRPVLLQTEVKGYKKILVLYANYGKLKKPEKTNWVMHQYHLGNNEDEKEGELVVSKIFYQTQPRQCGSSNIVKPNGRNVHEGTPHGSNNTNFIEYFGPKLISFQHTNDLSSRDGSSAVP